MRTLFEAENACGTALHGALGELGAALEGGFVRVQLRPGVPGRSADFLSGSFQLKELDGLSVAHFRGSPMSGFRTPGDIRRAPRDDYLVAVHLNGAVRAGQDGRLAVLGPGDLMVLDASRPYSIALGGDIDFEHLMLRVPKSRLNSVEQLSERATAIRISARSEAGRVLAPYFTAMASPDWIETALTTRFVESALDLLGAALIHVAGLPVAMPPHALLLQRAQRAARGRLSDPYLAPSDIAKDCAISVRQLHRLFSREGSSFGAWVREQRLTASYRDLSDPGMNHVKIADIALRWGYRSGAHFTREFSRRYGLRPRDIRRGRATPPAVHERTRTSSPRPMTEQRVDATSA